MYPWATKEYLLWEMTIGQIALYYRIGSDIKAGKKASSILASKSAKELKEMRDRIIRDAEGGTSPKTTALMQHKYGAING